jgi:hypothetical protein
MADITTQNRNEQYRNEVIKTLVSDGTLRYRDIVIIANKVSSPNYVPLPGTQEQDQSPSGLENCL